MATFSMKAPEEVAKFYGGNKQKILQALHSGALRKFAPAPFDELVALAAANVVDEFRAAAQAEQVPQQTLFQKTFTPPAPSMGGAPMGAAPMGGAPAGLGATPEAAQMQAPMPAMGAPEMPPQEMPPQEMPMMADGGMVPPYASGGGLSDIPVPDGIFDEPSNGGFNDGYAGGGIVAFDGGGEIDAATLRRALRAQESSDDYGALNKEGSGAMGAYQFMPPTARALAERLGLRYQPELMTGAGGRSKAGREYQELLMNAQMEDILRYSKGDPRAAAAYHFAGPNKKGHGPKTRKYAEEVLARMGQPGKEPEQQGGESAQDAEAADMFYGVPISDPRSAIELARELTPQDSTERTAYMEDLRKRLSPEEEKKDRKLALWEAVGAIGRGLGEVPGFAAGLAKGFGEATPAFAESIGRQKKERRELRKDMATLENLSNEEKRALSKMGIDLYSAGVEGRERREASERSQQTQIDVANIYADAKGDAANIPVGATPKGKIALAKDLQKITDRINKEFSPQLDMAQSANNPTQLKMFQNQKLAAIQQQEDELYAAYGMEPPKRKPVNVPINGKTYTFPNMYSALEAIRAYNAKR